MANKIKKPVEIQWYSCIRRYYNIKNEKTLKKEQKKMWIVIGDGHKWYRKFESQADAIKYFRKLKKYAKMRIQSVSTQEFVKNVSTFLELEKSGIEVKKIKQTNLKNHHKKWDDSKDFEDEFSKFDTFESSNNDNQIQADIDNIIKEKEGEYFIGSTVELNQEINENEEEELIYVKSDPICEDEVDINKEDAAEKNEKIENQQASVQTQQNEKPQIYYSKFNPLIIKKAQYGHGAKVFNFFKYSIIILMIIFGMMALWYSSQWESETLSKLGIDFMAYVEKDPHSGGYVTTNPIFLIVESDEWKQISKLGLYEWKNNIIDPNIYPLLMIFSFIGIIGSIPLLIFKKGTLFSVSLLFVVFAALVIVIVIFVFGMMQSNEVSSIFRSINSKMTTNDILKVLTKIKYVILS